MAKLNIPMRKLSRSSPSLKEEYEKSYSDAISIAEEISTIGNLISSEDVPLGSLLIRLSTIMTLRVNEINDIVEDELF